MQNSIEAAFEKMNGLKGEFDLLIKQKLNESDTRLKILDRYLLDILGWRHESIFTEPSTESGFIDYLLTIGENVGCMVIEAKRGGLLSPNTKSNELMHVALSGPVVKPLLPGIRQALSYALENGVPIAAVSDGNTWLFFKASRGDGKKPIDGKGVLFPNIEAVMANFAKFAELVSLNAIINKFHIAHLNEAEGVFVAEAEQQYYAFNPKDARMKRRDPLASDAALLFAQFFSRLSNEKDKEMLRDCFVETSESKKADIELEKIIQRVMNTVTSIDTGNGIALQAELERALNTENSETVLLIGNNGAGKSTFIDRFFEQVLPKRLRERCVVAHVNLEMYPGGEQDGVVDWAILELRSKLESGICSSNPPVYDELMGIFFNEYQRWSVGTRKHLYDVDKIKFKDEFGAHIEERREKNPGEYVKLLLAWAVRSHKKLPCLIFDNTDQFSSHVQDAIYQMAHSLEGASAVFNVVPITDRTVWRLSKAGALQSYSARSFYLPTPDAKEIISRRVEFLKNKIGEEPGAARSYFSKKGFQVEINDLAILADAVGKVFIENDYISGFIGRLGNFNIRRMLKIAERVFLSPELKIDDIMMSKFGGEQVTANRWRAERALIKGEYDRYNEDENEFVSNLFQTNPSRPESPLLSYYILWLLRHRSNTIRSSDDNIEERHWVASDLCMYFEGCGVSEEFVMSSINRLYKRRLLEALDPNVDVISPTDKVAIKESGLAHLDLVNNSRVYIEQMSLTTGLNEMFVRDEIKRSVHPRWDGDVIRSVFVRYLLKIDSGRLTVPSNVNYAQLSLARGQIQGIS